MIICPDCDASNEVNAPFCLSCGHRFIYSKRRSKKHFAKGDTIPEGQNHVLDTKQKSLKETQKHPTLVSRTEPEYIAENNSSKPKPFLLGGVVLALVALVGFFLLNYLDENPSIEVSEGFNVVSIPKGKVLMGLSDEAKVLLLIACQRVHPKDSDCDEAELFKGEEKREMKVEAFKIDKFEVSNREFEKCVDAKRCKHVESCEIRTHEGKQFGYRPPKILSKPDHPVVCTSFNAAQTYCEYKGGTLPSYAQYLRASRGSDRRIFPWGDNWDPEITNWGERDILQTPVLGSIDGFGFSAPQGHFDAGCSPFGVCDLSGNVAEWGKNEAEKPAFYGGSWTSLPFDLRVTLEHIASEARTDVGFRCVYSAS